MFWFGLVHFAVFIPILFHLCLMQCLPVALSQSTVCVRVCSAPEQAAWQWSGKLLGWIKYPSLSWALSESSVLNVRVQEACLNCIEIRWRVAGLALQRFQFARGLGPWGLEHINRICARVLGRAGHSSSAEVQEVLLPLGSALSCPGRSCPACLWLCALIHRPCVGTSWELSV